MAYFVQSQAVLGLPDYEAQEAGAVWRFHNEGNRASFLAHPEVYGPQFGGYDPIDVARGVTFAGNPNSSWSSASGSICSAWRPIATLLPPIPQHFLPEARERWPQLEQTLPQ